MGKGTSHVFFFFFSFFRARTGNPLANPIRDGLSHDSTAIVSRKIKQPIPKEARQASSDPRYYCEQKERRGKASQPPITGPDGGGARVSLAGCPPSRDPWRQRSGPPMPEQLQEEEEEEEGTSS